jgi:hypothetical protein
MTGSKVLSSPKYLGRLIFENDGAANFRKVSNLLQNDTHPNELTFF